MNFELNQNDEKRRRCPQNAKNGRFIDIKKSSSAKIWSQLHKETAHVIDHLPVFRFSKLPSQLF
jgi:hypothetical protein